MKILHLGKYYAPVVGGIESVVRDLCSGLADNDFDVTCAVSSVTHKSSVEVVDGVKVIRFGRLFNSRHPVNLGLPAFVKRGGFGIVHLHMPNPSAELAVLLARPRKLVISYHADVVGKFGSSLYLPFQRKILRMADKIIVSSEKYARSSSMLRPFLHKCVFIPYGVDVKKFRARKSGLAVPGPGFLFVGRLVEYKGLKYLIRAMKSVEGSLIIAGNGPLLRELRAEAKGLRGRVHFLRNISDDELPALYNSCDVLVLPSVSRAEAFGIVQLEAMACGKPVISTVDFVNQHMKTGLVVPPADVGALADAMKRLGDKKLRLKLGAYAKRLVRREFQAGRMVGRVLRVYQG